MIKKFAHWSMAIVLILGLSYCPSFAKMETRQTPTEKQELIEEKEIPAPDPFTGIKKRIGVAGFENKSGRGGERALGEGMAEMLTTALHNTGRFIIVERTDLQDILSEQKLQEQGKLVKTTGPATNRLIGAQILIRGAVTEFEASKAGGAGGIAVHGIGIGVGGSVAHVGLDIRIYDTSTGQVLQSHRAVGEAKTTGLAVGGASGDIAFGAAGFSKTPLGEATRKAINNAVNFIVNEMENVPWQSSIVKVDSNNVVYISGGKDMNMSSGNTYTVYGVGEELIDPATGLSLGREESKIGRIQVTSVEEKFSKAKILEGSGFKYGDVVK
ncbi:MAG: CsgG/HfaB family protein [Candidatus Ratteibacteria bacterium]|nr:CsgG/HfaB family protein [Candidatus Ratteibacteria bacterium]